uniref:Uncharacterized protein n=1 Tax=Pristionchus pacificus TaxID=54126 RepID=A0A2A6CCU6_PRIPA|eukprot:PDM75949.1 hypothetical protein PRIPAC_43792 [Pristionchus pacificus]
MIHEVFDHFEEVKMDKIFEGEEYFHTERERGEREYGLKEYLRERDDEQLRRATMMGEEREQEEERRRRDGVNDGGEHI